MRRHTVLGLILLCGVAAFVGCARTMRDTEGFATTDAITVPAPFSETWQTAKSVLREHEYDIYTRDKRGVFVAFSKSKRHLLVGNRRTKYTVAVEAISENSTQVTVEGVRQVFGVTLLTYPGWHDRKTTDHSEPLAILQAIEAKVSGSETAQRTDPVSTSNASAV